MDINDDKVRGLKRLGVNAAYSRIFRIIDAIYKLQVVYAYDILVDDISFARWGIYYPGSTQNPKHVDVMFELLGNLNEYRDDDRVLTRCKEVGLVFKVGPYGINDCIIRGLSTPFGVLWFDGAPGANAPQKDLIWEIA